MPSIQRLLCAGVAAVVVGSGASMAAETAADMQRSFEAAARQSSPAFAGFSAQRGEQFFKATHGSDWSCASCHGEDPLRGGRHAKTGKPIAPLSPAANAERFTSTQKVEKWFKRNCHDVLGRECSPLEKGDVLAYLVSLKR